MLSSTTQITIAAPIEAVFDYLSHMQNDPDWCTEIVEVAPNAGHDPMLGATYRMVVRAPMQQVGGYEITRFEPPTAMEWRVWQAKVTGTGDYALESVDGGTRLSYTSKVTFPGIMRYFEPLLGIVARGVRIPRALRNLKRLLELQEAA